MKKTTQPKLQLHRETLHRLEIHDQRLDNAQGGIVSTDNLFDCGTKMSGERQVIGR